MFYIEIDENGIPIRWSSSSFEEATETASFDVDLSTVYFKSGETLQLPPKPDYPCNWSLISESWEINEDVLLEQIRVERNKRLSSCDWTQVADAPVDKEAWATYRQALRDVPSQEGFPETVTWPVAP